MKKRIFFACLGVLIGFMPKAWGFAFAKSSAGLYPVDLDFLQAPNDTTKGDTSKLKYPIKPPTNPFDRTNNPFLFNDPTNKTSTVVYDPITQKYILTEKIGDMVIGTPTSMSFEEYLEYQSKNSKTEYWKEKSKSSSSGSLERTGIIPKLYLPSKAVDKIFGGSFVDIRPQGTAELLFAGNYLRNENPNLTQQQQRIGNFDFKMNIQMNVTGQIGEKMKFTAAQNTQAQFDFENRMKLEYTGLEDEIIKKLEVGNVTLPLRSALIPGSQSLFGVKGEFQFGKLRITTVLSQQKGQSQSVQVAGGAQTTQFDISADQYDQNRHYFLAQYFRDNFNNAMGSLPVLRTNVIVTRVEVWVTNRNNINSDVRDVLAFMDLAEANYYDQTGAILPSIGGNFPNNDANTLYNTLLENPGIRNVNQSLTALDNSPLRTLQLAQDYETTFARKLNPTEYTLNAQLGFISLNSALNQDEVLSVAYEYTINGSPFQVGEFSQEVPNDQTNPQILYTKMLKATNIRTDLPLWKLQMRNIYSLNAFQINRQDFQMNVIYNELTSGIKNFIPLPEVDKRPLIQVVGLDNLNYQLEPQPDGIFDYIEGVTIYPQTAKIIFPTVEPFGRDLRDAILRINPNLTPEQVNQFLFTELYDSTRAWALQFPEKNRYKLRGQYQSASGSEINLGAINLPPGSVTVTAGGRLLTEKVDYDVDYLQGKVKILNTGLLSSGEVIDINFENNLLFSVMNKTLTATRLDYVVNRDLALGSTFIRQVERPITPKVNFGEEPTSNSILGFDGTYRKESRFITKMIDAIPLISTKEISTVSFTGEYARLIPGNSKAITREGISYIDDFEGAENSIDLRVFGLWTIASTPVSDKFPEANLRNDLRYGYNRAKLAWYAIDPLFFRDAGITPQHIRNDAEMRSNHYMREVLVTEVFPNRQLPNNAPLNVQTLDLAYYPKERGPYNYDPSNIGPDGLFTNPEDRWGGIQRKIETNDFEAANIEFIEFWVMDPFIYNQNAKGGDFYINLGSVSEDVLKDGRRSFENGLPRTADITDVDETAWGRVPKLQPIVNAFDNDPASRVFQDIGLDGLNDEDERIFFQSYLDTLGLLYGVASPAYQQAFSDPSSDNYHHFRGTDYDNEQKNILERYSKFNGLQGNSPTDQQSPESYPTTATNIPNTEDINLDNTLTQNEDYFEYKVSLRPQDMVVGRNNINDVYTAVVRLKNGSTDTVRWYQFRIPIAKPDKRIGNIPDFKSIRFMRMYLTGFEDTTIMRFATLQLVRTDWRRYQNTLAAPGEYIPVDGESGTLFSVSTVNIEENGNRRPINYAIPPGIQRVQNVYSTNFQQLNEQSLQLRFCNLQDGDARAVFKNQGVDIRAYKRLRMFVHIEGTDPDSLKAGDINAFIRLGNDYVNNYYEYEIPLTPSQFFNNDPENIWPVQNELDVTFTELNQAKQARNNVNHPLNIPFTIINDRGHKITILGNPILSALEVVMLGIRNPKNDFSDDSDDGLSKCGEVWFNELRLTDFDNRAGSAGMGLLTLRLADLATVNLGGRFTTVGFGGIESKPADRSRDDVRNIDFNSTIELGKFFPERFGVRIPMYYGLSRGISNPEYNPLDPDILLASTLEAASNPEQRDSILRAAQTFNSRRSINFTNIQKMRMGTAKKPRFYDIENFALNFAFNETFLRNPFTEYNINKQYRGGFNYNFSNQPNYIQPFKSIRNKRLTFVRDFNFNLKPSNFTFRTDVDRLYQEVQMRNNSEGGIPIPPTFNKNFSSNRIYNFRHDLTRSLRFEFNANTAVRFDEPFGAIDTDEKRDTILQNIKNFGRPLNYQHNANVNYNLPFNKIKMLNWINGSYAYGFTYNWTAAPLAADSLGNTIQNAQNHRINGQLNLVGLYNKIDYLKRINANQPSKKREEEQKALKANKKAKPEKEVVLDQFKQKIGEKDKKKKDEDPDELPINYGEEILRKSLRAMMALRNISVSVATNDGLFLPGFLPDPNILGNNLDRNAPGWGFVTGSQRDPRTFQNIQDLISLDTNMNQLLVQTKSINLNLRAVIEPIQDFRIELNATRVQSTRNQDLFRADENGFIRSFNPVESGNFSISIISIRTSFEKVNRDFTQPNYLFSEVFRNFENSRFEIANRLRNENPNSGPVGIKDSIYPLGYSRKAQDVLIPAFLAAYTGVNPSTVSLNPFPSVPLPNWRITYTGLNKIGALKNIFTNFTISHSYRSTYSMNNFITNLQYEETNGAPSRLDAQRSGDFFPKFMIGQITIQEQMAPLIGIDFTTTNNIIGRVDFARDRSMTLSLLNNRLTEIRNSDFTIGAGYRINGSKLPFTVNGKPLENDINFRFDFTIRDGYSLLRDVDGDIPLPSGGMRTVSIRPNIDYMINDRINVRFFLDRMANRPVISTTFPNSTTNGGFSIRFTLAS